VTISRRGLSAAAGAAGRNSAVTATIIESARLKVLH
jgi:hypothetical protein